MAVEGIQWCGGGNLLFNPPLGWHIPIWAPGQSAEPGFKALMGWVGMDLSSRGLVSQKVGDMAEKTLFLGWQSEFLSQWDPQHTPSPDANGVGQSYWGEMVTQVTWTPAIHFVTFAFFANFIHVGRLLLQSAYWTLTTTKSSIFLSSLFEEFVHISIVVWSNGCLVRVVGVSFWGTVTVYSLGKKQIWQGPWVIPAM